MATTYKAIATVTVGSGGAGYIEFTSIPGTYTDLCILSSLRNNDSTYNDIQVFAYFNGSTTSYARQIIYGDGSGSGAANVSNATAAFADIPAYTSSTFSNNILYIPNYTSSNYKSYLADMVTENNATGSYTGLYGLLWSNTAAITSIKLQPNAGNLVQYSTATLYGIKNS
jgi:hypothetical protein